MYDNTTKSFTMRDASNSMDWITEGLDPADHTHMTDEELLAWIDVLVETAKGYDREDIEARAGEISYPHMGYTTAQVFEDEDEYLAFKREEMDNDYAAERAEVFNFLKTWLGQGKQEEWREFDLPVAAVYNPGEWRLSEQIIGPRGGKSWRRLTHGIAATGGIYRVALKIGVTYKVTYWRNGWPISYTFVAGQDAPEMV